MSFIVDGVATVGRSLLSVVNAVVGGTAWVVKATVVPSNLHPGDDYTDEIPDETVERFEKAVKWCEYTYRLDTKEEALSNKDVKKFVSVNNTQCFVGSEGSTLICAFRGSTTVMDFMQAFNYNLVPNDHFPGKLHSGFSRGFEESRTEVADTIEELLSQEPNLKTLLIVGHSMGGAIACIYSTWYKKRFTEKFPNIAFQVCTLGSPKPGDPEFAVAAHDLVGDDMHRWVAQTDIVTRMPPDSLFLRYGHAGQMHYVSGDWTVWAAKNHDAQVASILAFSDWLDGLIEDGAGVRFIDHNITEYRECLEKYKELRKKDAAEAAAKGAAAE